MEMNFSLICAIIIVSITLLYFAKFILRCIGLMFKALFTIVVLAIAYKLGVKFGAKLNDKFRN